MPAGMFEEKREAVMAIEAAVLPLIPKALAARSSPNLMFSYPVAAAQVA